MKKQKMIEKLKEAEEHRKAEAKGIDELLEFARVNDIQRATLEEILVEAGYPKTIAKVYATRLG